MWESEGSYEEKEGIPKGFPRKLLGRERRFLLLPGITHEVLVPFVSKAI